MFPGMSEDMLYYNNKPNFSKILTSQIVSHMSIVQAGAGDSQFYPSCNTTQDEVKQCSLFLENVLSYDIQSADCYCDDNLVIFHPALTRMSVMTYQDT